MYDGKTGNFSLIGNYCGTTNVITLTSTSSVMYVRFFSDNSISGAGFKASVSVQCGFTLRITDFLEFSSVDYDEDGMYDNNLNCTWTIVTTNYTLLQLDIEFIDIEWSSGCKNDYLLVSVYTIQKLHILVKSAFRMFLSHISRTQKIIAENTTVVIIKGP